MEGRLGGNHSADVWPFFSHPLTAVGRILAGTLGGLGLLLPVVQRGSKLLDRVFPVTPMETPNFSIN